jgi:hypothetical protein
MFVTLVGIIKRDKRIVFTGLMWLAFKGLLLAAAAFIFG